MKMKTLLAAAAMFFGLSTAAFASVTFGVGSTPVTKIVATGHTEASKPPSNCQSPSGERPNSGRSTMIST